VGNNHRCLFFIDPIYFYEYKVILKDSKLSRSKLKKQLAIPLVSTFIIALIVYLLNTFAIALENLAVRLTGMPSAYRSLLLLISIAFWISLTFIVVRLLGEAIFGFIFQKRKGYEAPSLVRDLFSLVAYVILFALIFKQFFPEIPLGALFTTSAVFGVIIGLALQETLGNLFAGLSLHADKPFQVGDVITVNQWTGVVESITWRAIKIRTFQNHIILLSNSSVAKEAIEVCPRNNVNARIIVFQTTYSNSPAKVIHVVRDAVREAENVSQKFKPIIRIRNLAESGVDYEVKYWLDNYALYNDTDALLRQRIWYAINRAGLNFAFPTRTVHLYQEQNIEIPKTTESDLHERLSAIDIFSPLSLEEISNLAANIQSHIFAPGEVIIREAEDGSSMFIVHKGRVKIQRQDKARTRTIATLHEGDIFGEMGLFTGEPRTASVVAAEETEVLEIHYAAMKQLFDTNPDLVESISQTIAERRASLAALPETQETIRKEVSAGLLNSIKKFFRLD
jgi:small-conductance mechanosensitive channel/CRP-like cAMP-binding protein